VVEECFTVTVRLMRKMMLRLMRMANYESDVDEEDTADENDYAEVDKNHGSFFCKENYSVLDVETVILG
jgi:hypothetical protein